MPENSEATLLLNDLSQPVECCMKEKQIRLIQAWVVTAANDLLNVRNTLQAG